MNTEFAHPASRPEHPLLDAREGRPLDHCNQNRGQVILYCEQPLRGAMSRRRFFLVVILLLSAMASAWAKDLPLHIKVLSAESREFQGPPLAPPDCNWRDISAYCYSSSPETYVENTMVVQESNGKSLEIACTVYNQWSHCASLPVNQSFQARMEKHGLENRYLDQHGKIREQVYEILRENGKEVVNDPRLGHAS